MNEARDFKLQLDAEWAAKVEDISEAVAGIAMVALGGSREVGIAGVVRRSPVATGRFRGNWIVSVGGANGATFEQVDPSGGRTISAGMSVLAGYPDTLPPIYIQNNLPYANRLENGWSKQAPQGMVALTVAELNASINGKEV